MNKSFLHFTILVNLLHTEFGYLSRLKLIFSSIDLYAPAIVWILWLV